MLDPVVSGAEVLLQKRWIAAMIVQLADRDPAHDLPVVEARITLAVELPRTARLHQEIKRYLVAVQSLVISSVAVPKIFMDHSEAVDLVPNARLLILSSNKKL